MRGVNTYQYNHATAEEAFAEYINKRTVGGGIVVTGVNYDSSKSVFKVMVKPAEVKQSSR